MQANTKERIGDRAVRLGFLSQAQLTQALSEQERLRQAGGARMPLGIHLLEQGLISAAQLGELLGRAPGSLASLHDDAIELAARLAVLLDEAPRIVLATAFARGAGTTTVVAQLGTALALMDHAPVLLVDANQAVPGLHRSFSLPQAPGLGEYLTADAPLGEVIHDTAIAGLAVLPSGAAEAGLTNRVMVEHGIVALRRLSEQYRLILLDCPALPDFPEASLLAQRVDGVISVVAAGQQRVSQVQQFNDLMTQVRANLLGVIVTHPEASRG